MNVNSRIARANFTGYASGSLATFTGLRDTPIKVRAYINSIQTGSGDPSPDNIRPISGVSECNVTRCGKNVWSYGNVSGTKRVAVTVDIKAGTYTLSANVTTSDTDYDYNNITFYYEDNTTESVYINRGTRQKVTFTLSKNVERIIFYASRGYDASADDTFSFTDIQLEVGSTATAYEAYTGNTYTIQLGDTYYGGSLDVTTGVLTIDKAYMDLSDITSWTYSSSWSDTTTNVFYSSVMSNIYYPSYTYLSVTNSDRFSVGTRNQIYNKDGIEKVGVSGTVNSVSITIRISNARATNSSELITWLSNNPTHIIYELATPVTVQLTPIQVEQIIGTNNIFSDTGNVEVYYVTI